MQSGLLQFPFVCSQFVQFYFLRLVQLFCSRLVQFFLEIVLLFASYLSKVI